MLAPTLTEHDREADAVQRGATYRDLFAELFGALVQCDPGRLVRAPGCENGAAPAHYLFYDELAGKDADDMRSRAVYIIGCAARQTGNEQLQQMALRFLRDVADRHAAGRSGL